MRSRREVLRVIAWSGAGLVLGAGVACSRERALDGALGNLDHQGIAAGAQKGAARLVPAPTPEGAMAGGGCGLPEPDAPSAAGPTCGGDALAAAERGGGEKAEPTNEVPVKVELTHDVICPWCRIGHHRLKQAMAAAGRPVEVVYRAFLLDPDVPAEGVDLRQRLAEKYGAASLDGMFERVTQIGNGDGLTFDFAKVTRTPNTISAHMLVDAAPAAAKTAFLDRLHTAYFERGDDIGSREVLLGHWVEVGLAKVDGERALDDAALRARVTAEAAGQARAGVRGVPFFRIGATTVSGAQSSAVLADAIRKA